VSVCERIWKGEAEDEIMRGTAIECGTRKQHHNCKMVVKSERVCGEIFVFLYIITDRATCGFDTLL
jgi:hypothetical protein